MASWIVLDWDHDQFQVVVAQTSRRNVRVTHALTWSLPEPLSAASADVVGKALREALNSAGIASAPVIVGLGRDRVFLKELRFPAIEAYEEANLVRFQTAKELPESIDNYAVDYMQLNADTNDRQIMTVAAKRDIVGAIQTMCQSAGLKLHAITPRVFGVADAVARASRPEPTPLGPGRLSVVLTAGQRWVELCFFQGERLSQAQALANGQLLVSEVRRNLAVFQAQHAVDVELTGPDALYVFGEDRESSEDEGEDTGVVSKLRAGQPLSVQTLNPLAEDPDLSREIENPGCFAGGVGLASLWTAGVQKPVNLASPKRQSAPVSATKQRGILWGAGIAVGLAIFIGCLWGTLAYKRAQLQRLTVEKNKLEQELYTYRQERADVEAYKDWVESSVNWLDEDYDLTARFPWEIGFYLSDMTATSPGTRKNAKDPYIGKLSIKGNIPTGKAELVKRLAQNLSGDVHLKAQADQYTGNKFDMQILIARQPKDKYTTVLTPPPQYVPRQPGAQATSTPTPNQPPLASAKTPAPKKMETPTLSAEEEEQ